MTGNNIEGGDYQEAVGQWLVDLDAEIQVMNANFDGILSILGISREELADYAPTIEDPRRGLEYEAGKIGGFSLAIKIIRDKNEMFHSQLSLDDELAKLLLDQE